MTTTVQLLNDVSSKSPALRATFEKTCAKPDLYPRREGYRRNSPDNDEAQEDLITPTTRRPWVYEMAISHSSH